MFFFFLFFFYIFQTFFFLVYIFGVIKLNTFVAPQQTDPQYKDGDKLSCFSTIFFKGRQLFGFCTGLIPCKKKIPLPQWVFS